MVEGGISVVGRGEVKAEPDTVVLQIGVNVTRVSVADATRDAAGLARAMIAALVAGGVAERDIQTSNVSVNPNYQHQPNRQPTLIGYTFTNTVVAVIRSVDRVGELIDGALAAGGDDAVLQGLVFLLEDDARAAVEARAAAWADARAKAEQLAELAGVGLGAAVSIEEVAVGAPFPPPQPMMLRAAAEADTAIAPGQVTTAISVSVRFAIC